MGPRVRHRSWCVLALTLATPQLHAAEASSYHVVATVTGLRSHKGQVLACLTTRPDVFPHCDRDPHAHRLIVSASDTVRLDFPGVVAGRYALSLIHDENGNGKLDTRLMIPREGFGFSRDAPARMGPPRFASAAFAVTGGDVHLAVRMRYML